MAKNRIMSATVWFLTVFMLLNIYMSSTVIKATAPEADITGTTATNAAGNQYYEITLSTDQNIALGSDYWNRNLQQIAPANAENLDVEAHNALAQIIRESIIINGMSIDDALAAADDKDASTQVSTSGTALIIKVKKTDNPYHLDPISYFSLEIREGITLNGYAVVPKKYYVRPHTGFDWNTNFDEIGLTADVISAIHKDGVITISTDKNIVTDDVSTAENNILIDGEPVGLSYISVADNKILIDYAATDEFDMQIKPGIIFNGIAVMPARYSFGYHAANTTFRRQESATEGALRARFIDVHDQQSGYCASHGLEVYNPEQWLIDIVYDQQETLNTGLVNYYNNHLQAYGAYSSMICDGIHLNGKTLTECISEDARDVHTAVHIAIIRNMGGYMVLQIAVPKDNAFGFNGDSDFTIQVDDGIAITNDGAPMVFGPVTVLHTGEYRGGGMVKNRATGITYYNDTVLIHFEKGFTANTVRNAAQAADRLYDAVDQETALQLCEHIKLNGKTLTKLFGSVSDNFGFYLNFTTESDGSGSISLKAVNSTLKPEIYLSNIELVDGFVLDGYSISAEAFDVNMYNVNGDKTGGGLDFVNIVDLVRAKKLAVVDNPAYSADFLSALCEFLLQ